MPKQSKINDQDLSLPLDINTERWSRLSGGVIAMSCTVLLALVVIAAITPVREISIANGQLTTPNPPIDIEHFDGGMVAEILVRQGQVIEAGTPIIRLSRTEVESELARVRSRNVHQSLQRERLLAHVEGRQPRFPDVSVAMQGLVQEQLNLFRAESAAITAEDTAYRAGIAELELEQAAADREAESLHAQLTHVEAEVALQSGLFDRGFTTRTRVLVTRREMERVRGDMAAAQRSSLGATRASSEARRNSLAASSERLRLWSEQISELSASIAELEESERQQVARLKRLVVDTPVTGIVQEIAVRGVGDVLAAGDHVATIVPTSAELVAEVRLDPADISFVGVGSTAEVTVTTFDREIFGTLEADVISISPTTFQIRDEPPHYIVKLSVDRFASEQRVADLELLPGMVLHAEFRTGEKSILRYMLKPIARALDRAFTER